MGALSGIKVVELAGIGPGPFVGMLLADAGADIIRIDRPGAGGMPHLVVGRGRLGGLEVDLKRPEGVEAVLRLTAAAEVLVEGFRPGVTERLGLGPDACLARNPRLVYARMTGWGQDGPLAPRAGHDINYIAISGVLHAFTRAGERPVPPLNLVGDYGGGAMFCAFGILAALLEARGSGRGQVVDAAMTDGSAALGAFVHGMRGNGSWSDEPGTNLLDTGAPFYDVYETADGGHMAVGCIEPQFYARFLAGLGLDPSTLPAQTDRDGWPTLRARFAEILRTRTRAAWTEVFQDTDACVTPVLTWTEAAAHPHNAARGTYVERDGTPQPAAAPRLSRTPSRTGGAPGMLTPSRLAAWGLETDEVEKLRTEGVLSGPGL
ncbi:CoA transferase [Yinghuangia sp. ASG 101]|uniref:CaiB/BaiF CoA transferase family protein n=1 Tax=Yinghuangia sp. ASG 101 TaxID=2896848 RepID=UPI001E4EAB35|nr:CaiB/BaiF CoA-transferase family protein [Yinghuangia sp. ASG 101]UGQ13041.1 CoA transferase [Yinghuangia sp. ASG 101]